MGHLFSCMGCFASWQPLWADVEKTTYVTVDDADTVDMLLWSISEYSNTTEIDSFTYKNTVYGIKELIKKYKSIRPLLHNNEVVPKWRIVALERNLTYRTPYQLCWLGYCIAM